MLTISEWEGLLDLLAQAYVDAAGRNGSFADAVAERCDTFEQAMEQMMPVEKEAAEVLIHWMQEHTLLPASPGANRLLELRFHTALQTAKILYVQGCVQIPPQATQHQFLCWLIYDLFAATTQVGLDCMRNDLLMFGTDRDGD